MGPMCCWLSRLSSSVKTRHPLLDGVHQVGVQLGVAEVQIAVGQHQRVAEVRVEAVEEGGVVRAAGQRALERRRQASSRVLHREEAGVRRTPERPRTDQRALRPMAMPGKLGLLL